MTGRRRLSAVADQPARVVLYVRVSALMGRVGDAFHSPGLQLEAMQRVVDARGMVVVDRIEDIDRTGRNFDRTGIQRVLEMARSREIDAIALYDLSRLGRNTGESLRHITELRDLGVSVVSTVEQIDDTPEGQFMLGQFLGMAQLYSDQMGRRWQQVIARRAEQGRWHGSNAPFGYQLGDDGLEPHPVNGPMMTEVFRRYAAGHLVSHIAQDLTRRRGTFHAVSTLKRQLYSPVYVGNVRLGGEVFPGRHEALVDDQTWERVQRRLARDRRTASRHLGASHSLVGLVVCDHCGRHLNLHVDGPRGNRQQDVPRLQCPRRVGGGPTVCGGPGTPAAAAVEEAVLVHLREWISQLRSDSAERAAKQARRARATVDVGRLRREVEKTEAALGRLTADRARRDITDQAYRLASADLEQTLGGLRAQVDECEAVQESPAPRGTAKAAEDLLALWPVMKIDERNRALRSLIREVRVRRAAYRSEPFTVTTGGRVQVSWL